MLIEAETCIGCGKCAPFCTSRAIKVTQRDKAKGIEPRTEIVRDECVECQVCLRSGICPTGSLKEEELGWPRILRRAFSDPIFTHPGTDIPGRGTEEMKTNDVTGRFRDGFIGIGLEFGRPGVSTRLKDTEPAMRKLLAIGVTLEPHNPLTQLLADPTKGDLKPEVREEKVLSAIVECIVPVAKVGEVLAAVKEIAAQTPTVFSLDVISKVAPDGSHPAKAVMEAAGLQRSLNGKCNVGLGRPFVA